MRVATSERVVGTFPRVEPLIRAVGALRAEGHAHVRVLSPVPLDLAEALPERASPVRWFTLGGALLGAATGFGLTILTSLDYPLNTGGKPIVSLPAFLIIAFELAVLLGGLATFAGLVWHARLLRAPGEEPEEGLSERPSPVRRYALPGVSLGVVLGLILFIWSALEYRMIITGHLIVSPPPYQPVGAGVAVLLAVLFILARGRRPAPPAPRVRVEENPPYLDDPRYLDDRFGLVIWCRTGHAQALVERLRALGAEEVHRG
ncbi:MAG: DUF3341 domain-containing protein [Deltaproteobacteria bacterium]|nr:DUF3341 domain-containing protein [Deltaproteobacteria bacterium]MBI3075489.1 DUF3341 domain-containing protein [Deltaproteobacteria bacterium]